MKSNILIYCPRLLERGGIESHIHSFIHQMHDNYNLYLLVLDDQTHKEQRIFLKEKCKEVWFISHGSLFSRIFLLYSLTLRIRLFKFDYLYSNGQGDSIKIVRKLLSKNVIWVHHHHTSISNKLAKEWSKDYIFTLQNSNLLNTCSKSISQDMAFKMNREVMSIPCFSASHYEVSQKTIEFPIKLGFYGRLIPEKGITQLCLLSNLISPNIVEIHIWGKGKMYDHSFFSNYPNVNYHGSFSSKEELQKVLELIDAFILITEHPEGLPISLLEFLSTGKPWIATDMGGIKDVVCHESRNQLIPAGLNLVELKEQIENFVSKLVNQDNILNSQKQFYEQNFSMENIKKEWLKIFK